MRVKTTELLKTHISLEKVNSDEREYIKAGPSTTSLILFQQEKDVFVFTYEANVSSAVSSLLS